MASIQLQHAALFQAALSSCVGRLLIVNLLAGHESREIVFGQNAFCVIGPAEGASREKEATISGTFELPKNGGATIE